MSHPLACVDTSNKFIWVNSAYERLVGYSRQELRSMTWMSITSQSDVGGDLASASAITAGEDNRYSLNKHYIHKFGKTIPVSVTVWRFPREVGGVMQCFIVEAVPEKASMAELREVREQLLDEIKALNLKWQLLEEQQRKNSSVNVTMNDQQANNGGQNTFTNTYNSNIVLYVMGVIIIVLTTLALSGHFKASSPTGSIEVESNND